MPSVERALVAGDDRRADAAVAVVRDDLDARIADAARALDRRVARAVVDDVDAVDERRDAAQRRRDELLLVVRGHDDRDALALEHQPAAREPGGEAVPEERGERAEDEPDQRGDDDACCAGCARSPSAPRRR